MQTCFARPVFKKNHVILLFFLHPLFLVAHPKPSFLAKPLPFSGSNHGLAISEDDVLIHSRMSLELFILSLQRQELSGQRIAIFRNLIYIIIKACPAKSMVYRINSMKSRV